MKYTYSNSRKLNLRYIFLKTRNENSRACVCQARLLQGNPRQNLICILDEPTPKDEIKRRNKHEKKKKKRNGRVSGNS